MTDLTSQIIAYETGELTDEEVVALFQSLLDTGLCWRLQGHYGRTADLLLRAGAIAIAPEPPEAA